MGRRQLKPVPTIVTSTIVVEGKKRELLYFQQAVANSADPRRWRVVPAGGGDPSSLLMAANHALEHREDEVWVVADADRMQSCSPKEAGTWERLAALKGVRLTFSWPCIEVWFLLHFEDDLPKLPTVPEDAEYVAQCDAYKDRLNRVYPALDAKPLQTWKDLLPQLPEACRRCRDRRDKNLPRSGIDQLMRELGLDGGPPVIASGG